MTPLRIPVLRRLMEALTAEGVRVANPCLGLGSMDGTLQLTDMKCFRVRFDHTGALSMYDIREGTYDAPILRQICKVDRKDRNWPSIAAKAIAPHVVRTEEPKRKVQMQRVAPVQSPPLLVQTPHENGWVPLQHPRIIPEMGLLCNEAGDVTRQDGTRPVISAKNVTQRATIRGRGSHEASNHKREPDIPLADALAETWLGAPPTPKHKVVFRDGNPGNLHRSNLSWVEPKTKREKLSVAEREHIYAAAEGVCMETPPRQEPFLKALAMKTGETRKRTIRDALLGEHFKPDKQAMRPLFPEDDPRRRRMVECIEKVLPEEHIPNEIKTLRQRLQKKVPMFPEHEQDLTTLDRYDNPCTPTCVVCGRAAEYCTGRVK